MQLNAFLYRNGIFLSLIFAAIVVWGFWPTFYAHPLSLKTNLHLIHGIALSMWFSLLILQPALIRANLKELHRTVGTLSYVVAAMVVLSVLLLIHYRQRLQTPANDFTYGLLFFEMMNPVVFLLFYGLAIYYKKDVAKHARFMISTAFILMFAGLDRLMPRLFPGNPVVASFSGWFLLDLTIIVLAVWDWRSHKKLNVFPLVLGVTVLHEFAWYFAGQLSAWRHFADWFAAL